MELSVMDMMQVPVTSDLRQMPAICTRRHEQQACTHAFEQLVCWADMAGMWAGLTAAAAADCSCPGKFMLQACHALACQTRIVTVGVPATLTSGAFSASQHACLQQPVFSCRSGKHAARLLRALLKQVGSMPPTEVPLALSAP